MRTRYFPHERTFLSHSSRFRNVTGAFALSAQQGRAWTRPRGSFHREQSLEKVRKSQEDKSAGNHPKGNPRRHATACGTEPPHEPRGALHQFGAGWLGSLARPRACHFRIANVHVAELRLSPVRPRPKTGALDWLRAKDDWLSAAPSRVNITFPKQKQPKTHGPGNDAIAPPGPFGLGPFRRSHGPFGLLHMIHHVWLKHAHIRYMVDPPELQECCPVHLAEIGPYC